MISILVVEFTRCTHHQSQSLWPKATGKVKVGISYMIMIMIVIKSEFRRRIMNVYIKASLQYFMIVVDFWHLRVLENLL